MPMADISHDLNIAFIPSPSYISNYSEEGPDSGLFCNEEIGDQETPLSRRSDGSDDQDDVFASKDIVLAKDQKVVEKLNLLSNKSTVKNLQFPFPNGIRQILVSWMMEVCEEKHLEIQVFFSAVEILGKFVKLQFVDKNQLQMCACACLMISSKARQSRYLSPDMLSYLSDGSSSAEEIKSVELLILATVGWQVTDPTPLDFLPSLLELVPDVADAASLRRACTAVLSYFALENEYTNFQPATIATAAVLHFLKGLKVDQEGFTKFILGHFPVQVSDLRDCLFFVDHQVKFNTEEIQNKINHIEMIDYNIDAHCGVSFLDDSLSPNKSPVGVYTP